MIYLLDVVFPTIAYGLLFVLLVFLIILAYKIIKTLKKVDVVVEDVNNKSKKLNGLFDVIGTAADGLSKFSDVILNSTVAFLLAKFTKKKKKEKNKYE